MKYQELYRYWGKSGPKPDGPCHLLAYHCLDAAAVARELLTADRLLLQKLARLSCLDAETLLDLVPFLACLHDLGKISDVFQGLVPELMLRLQGRAPGFSDTANHRQLGLLAWEQGLRRELGSHELGGTSGDEARAWLDGLEPWFRACFCHHGLPEELPKRNRPKMYRDLFGPRGHEAVSTLAWAAGEICAPGLRPRSEAGPEEAAPYLAAASWLLAGILVAADWLASNEDYFPYRDDAIELADYWPQSRDLAQKALARSGLLPAEAAGWSGITALFPYIARPTPLQAWAAEVELAGDGPRLFILEESTGGGKTEAALILAQRILARGEAESIYVALPTTATANSMYNRLARSYRGLFAPEAAPSLTLAHSMRALHPGFGATVFQPGEAESVSDGKGESRAQCAAWLADSNKRSLLGSVGVGTIDQAVAAMMPLRHQSLRVMGLARSVLILDEVHAYDEYLLSLLGRGVLSHLAALGNSVILLSATLPGHMKQRLAQDFLRYYQPPEELLSDDSYPLATLVAPEATSAHPVATRPERETSFRIQLTDSLEQVKQDLLASARAGGCAMWVRNTVQDAMEAREELARELGEDSVYLLHARFALCDRLAREELVVNRFGPESKPKDRAGKIVVGTQVLEQSLDIDFDFVCSDLAPVDLLLQRAGRLHRHERVPRPCPEARLLVHGPLHEADPPADWYAALFPGGAYVYRRHAILWRTARLLADRSRIYLPRDARGLIERVYDPDALCPEGLQNWERRAEGEDQAAVVQAWHNALKWPQGYGMTQEMWGEDTPTRLGQRRAKLLLGRWQDGRLTPWSGEPGWRGWELSQVSVAHHLAADPAPVDDPELRKALDRVERDLGRRLGTGIIVPLIKGDDGIWLGRVLNAKGEASEISNRASFGLTIQ